MDAQQALRLKVSSGIIDCEPTVDSLKEKLIKLYPEIESGRKTADDFIQEILEAESNLDKVQGNIIRVVNTVAVYIKSPIDHNKELWELAQVYPDGKNERNFKGVREKIKGQESPADAAIRAVKEELNIDIVHTDLSSVAEEFLENPQSAYQGITSRTHLFSYSAIIKAEDYRNEYREITPKKTVIFGWR